MSFSALRLDLEALSAPLRRIANLVALWMGAASVSARDGPQDVLRLNRRRLIDMMSALPAVVTAADCGPIERWPIARHRRSSRYAKHAEPRREAQISPRKHLELLLNPEGW